MFVLVLIASVFACQAKEVPSPDKPSPARSEPQALVKQTQITPGDTLYQALKRLGLSERQRDLVVQKLSRHLDPRRDVLPGHRLKAGFDSQGQLLFCRYEPDPIEALVVKRNGQGFYVEKERIQADRRLERLQGQVTSSIYQLFKEAGEGRELLMAFVEIFASQIDFNLDVRTGDKIRLLYEKLYLNGRFVGYGRILAAEYRGQIGFFRAYYFRTSQGKTGYFDSLGQEVRSSFLRSPLPYYRLTSRFSRARLHPILKVVRPHEGVDLAAPLGTPVMAVADGRVKYAGWMRGYGRIVILRHPGGYETYYGHLLRFARGIKKGVSVKRKQIIGYVGQSGLATGPHLDYRVKKAGRFLNPLALPFRPAIVLKGSELENFLRRKVYLDYLLNLDEPQFQRVIETKNFLLSG
ncbi:M23 family metallopeptidase [Thermosulfuriphilus ammonigenes]|uniref:M23 family metallopeptidase n=1 Tax=Thermosulfuriphilus ammonigenes TaxID=1936021 RepID=A0A6G7PWL5_9BACT|nr:M23 family metallopeptidase [Thermosulfuriphilus ammonigenes]MBA2847716.1 murein DD-endopeptidase MepM/ murein hydrolase activator NlpD [Thermosulfuriphilus ammonigenes]QIJ72079.1 M23 family metallopeptidase [Thermosulfuriphilus ammonigenes]